MVAISTVAQPHGLRQGKAILEALEPQRIRLMPRHGVITLSGYGINVRVDRGHLLLEDGIGRDRWHSRLPRVGHKLKRLIVIGSDGVVSLAALQWLADQSVSFVMLNRDGSVLVTTGPVRSSDVRLRRAQALSLDNGSALRISRDLIERKLLGQERVTGADLGNEAAAQSIARFRCDLVTAQSIDSIRLIESQAAKVYWSAWRALPVTFPKRDLPRVPEHWLSFGNRVSSLTGSPRLATNPANAIVNYLYALLEAETRLAAATLGLDPGIGVLHVDTPYRDSLACDLMEPVRPEVDAFVLDWLRREPLLRSNFFERYDGNCRLMASFASLLSQTASRWAHSIAPIAEWFAREMSASERKRRHDDLPARLTQRSKRIAKGNEPLPAMKASVKPERICRGCGKRIDRDATHCKLCSTEVMTEQREAAGRLARIAGHTTDAEHKRANTQRVNAIAQHAWQPSDQPEWLTVDFYKDKIQPALAFVRSPVIAKHLNVSYCYARDIRKGKRVPHPRHWRILGDLAGGQERNQS